jgi:hypothetical protein
MIDGGGSGRDKNDDNRVDKNEWIASYKNVVDHGFIALQGISTKAEAMDVFKMIDDNGGGIILLDEWSFFIKKCEILSDTPIGRLLAADQDCADGCFDFLNAKLKPTSKPKPSVKKPPVLDEPRKRAVPLKKGGGLGGGKAGALKLSDGQGKSAEEQQVECRRWLSLRPQFSSDIVPNAFGLAVGKKVSSELKNFISVFEPLAAETPEGEALRAEGFMAADPNGEKKSTFILFVRSVHSRCYF